MRRLPLAVRLLTATAVVAPLAAVPATASAQTCGVLGRGPVKQTTAGFSQQIIVRNCLTDVRGRIHVHPNAGYAGSHVKACSLHIGIADEVTGWHDETTANCTTKARSGRTWELETGTGYLTHYLTSSRYHMTGYVNIKTGVGYYGTYPAASRFGWDN